MRPARVLVGMILVLTCGGRAWCQEASYTVTVIVPETEVRSGHSTDPQLYPTSLLHRGDRVEVVKDLGDGWLAIKPPQGSFSWINARFLQRINQTNWMVIGSQDVRVPVLIGSALHTRSRPTVEGVRVERGTQVIVIGRMQTEPGADGGWYPILPPPGEVRYIRASVVSRTTDAAPFGGANYDANSRLRESTSAPPLAPGAASTVTSPNDSSMSTVTRSFVPASRQTFGDASRGSSFALTSATSSSDPAVLYQQALQAEQAGRLQEAIRLWEEHGRRLANSDHARAVQSYNRANWLRRQLTGPMRDPAPSGPTASTSYPNGDQYYVQPVSYNQGPQGYSSPSDPRIAGFSAPYDQTSVVQGGPYQISPAAAGPSMAGGCYTSAVGRLRTSGRILDYKPTYVLETSQGAVRYYVTPQPGITLEPFLNQTVQVSGSAIYRGDVRSNYMIVSQITVLP